MSYKTVKVQNNFKTFLVSVRSDIEENKLPTSTAVGTNGIHKIIDNEKVSIGSKAVCTEDWSKWVLSPDNVWVELPTTVGGGSGSNGGNGSGSIGGDTNGDGVIDDEDFEIITEDEVNDIINSL